LSPFFMPDAQNLQLTNCICEARDLGLVRPLLMTKSTEIFVVNENIASALRA